MRGRNAVRALAFAIAVTLCSAKPRELSLRRVDLPLPGPPSVVLPVDLDADGRTDLVVVTAYTQWGSISNDRVENAVAITEVVPALFDHRELLPFLAQADGSYRAGPAFTMPASWIALAAGRGAAPIVALTEEGMSAVTWSKDKGLDTAPLFDERSALAGGRAFLAEFHFLDDVDGDGFPDAVIPSADGIAVHRGLKDGTFEAQASFRARLPEDRVVARNGHVRHEVPVPRFFDADGDGKKDLVVDDLEASPPTIVIARGLGAGRFAAPQTIRLGCLSQRKEDETQGPPAPRRRVAWFGPLERNARPVVVTREALDNGKSDRKQAMAPQMRYGLYRLGADLSVPTVPESTFDAEGYAFSGAFRDGVDLEFLDLDGDGRKDLVTVTVDVSMFQVLRALTSKTIGIGLDFRVVAQGADGVFRPVPDQVLHEKLKVDLNRFEISRLGQFQGDFDGDGRIDFVHLGKGKAVTVHRGQPGGRYPEKPDLVVEVEDEPEDVLLVRVRDFDGDSRSDIAITRTLPAAETGASAPTRLERYLSSEPR
jgi:hypothetical protein